MGDILPIKVQLTESHKPIVRVNEISMETAQLRIPPAELCARHKVSTYELACQTTGKRRRHKENLLVLKLRAMASDPAFKELLKPVRKQSSLLQGNLECMIREKEIVIPVHLEQPGLVSYKVTVNCGTPQSGPIYRTDMVSVCVEYPGVPVN
ncbi:MAG: hypothetical protein VR69_00340 [Peptococcaceae bacterium BRH_c4b]|nr:MAG: hypothetical protein VR69_00340 [Peptococcaceae bacterium BRH_c4b]